MPCLRIAVFAQSTSAAHVVFDDLTDGSQQTGHVTAAEPVASLRVKYGLQLLGDKTDIAATAKHCAYHSRESDCPCVMLKVAGVDENLKWTSAFERRPRYNLLDVVDRDINCVVAGWPLEFVSLAGQHRLSLQRLRHVDDALAIMTGTDVRGGTRLSPRRLAFEIGRSRRQLCLSFELHSGTRTRWDRGGVRCRFAHRGMGPWPANIR